MLKKILISISAVVIFFGASSVSAGPLDRAQNNLTKSLEKTGLASDLPTTIGTVVKAILSLVGTIFLLLTIYAGILWMTAQGNEDQVAKSKSIVSAAVIGLVITMSAYAITAFVTSKVGGVADTIPSESNSVRNCGDLGGQCMNPSACSLSNTVDNTNCISQDLICCLPNTD